MLFLNIESNFMRRFRKCITSGAALLLVVCGNIKLFHKSEWCVLTSHQLDVIAVVNYLESPKVCFICFLFTTHSCWQRWTKDFWRFAFKWWHCESCGAVCIEWEWNKPNFFFPDHRSFPVVSEPLHDWWEDLNRATFPDLQYTAIIVGQVNCWTIGTRRVKVKDKSEQPSCFFLQSLTLLFDFL